MLILVWIYYSAQIVFFGAEFTQVYARRFGSLRSIEANHLDDSPETDANLTRAAGFSFAIAGGMMLGALLARS